MISRICKNQKLDNVNVKNQIELKLIAVLFKFNQDWKLDKFLKHKIKIFKKNFNVKIKNILILQTQFFLQAQAVYTSLNVNEKSVSIIVINIFSDKISSSIFSNIQDYITVMQILLDKLMNKTDKTVQ